MVMYMYMYTCMSACTCRAVIVTCVHVHVAYNVPFGKESTVAWSHCRHLGSQLAEMERAIERMMEADLVHFAMEDISLRMRAISSPSLTPDISISEVPVDSPVYMYTIMSSYCLLLWL